MPPTSEFTLSLPRRTLQLGGRPRIMGVLNVTPDSFSDGGRFADAGAAVACGLQMTADGADLLDVGGESTRPGSAATPPDEQLRRVLPVVEGLRRAGCATPISIDTQSAEVARAALAVGAELVNDVSALRGDQRMAEACAAAGAGLVLMHMRGEPRTMQQSPVYGDVVREVADFLAERVRFAEAAGVAAERIVVDPGIGFGKSAGHNLALLRGLDALRALGRPVLIGASRKAFLGALTGESEPARRDAATAAVTLWCAARGAHLVRVHDVRATRQVLDVWAALSGAHQA